MNHQSPPIVTSILCTAAFTASCAASPTGRKQLHLLPDSEIAQMGVAAFEQLKQNMPAETDPKVTSKVKCVVDAVAEAARRVAPSNLPQQWEVVVFEDPQANAFALPGGKIGVYKGILEIAMTQGQLATVISHEISHVISDHGNERISTALATQSGLEILEAVVHPSDPEQERTRKMVFGLFGVGAEVGVVLPFSSADETEADRLGSDLMARAGFDPEEAVTLWKNFEATAGQPPQFLSDHPSHGHRLADLQARLPRTLSLYQGAIASGHTPACDLEPIALATELGD
jgi:predicted Zn-dependent protease